MRNSPITKSNKIVLPFRAYRYPSATVTVIFRVLSILASLFHTTPYADQSGVGFAMRCISLTNNLSHITTATFGITITQVRTSHNNSIAAIAFTEPLCLTV